MSDESETAEPSSPLGADDPQHPLAEELADETGDDELADDLRTLYDRLLEEGSIRDIYDRNPYAVLASAAGVGYVLGGGLLSPFSKRLARMGMKALVVPLALSKFKELTQSATQPELEESDDSSQLGGHMSSESER